MRWIAVAGVLALLACKPAVPRDPPAIALSGRVTDAAHILSPATSVTLNGTLARYERASGYQFVVVTAPTLQGRDVSAFTQDLANAWRIGNADRDDGLVLLVAPNERKVRLEVGRGLETVLTNNEAKHVIDAAILPRFKTGDLEGGIVAGVDATIAALPPQP